MSPGLAFVLAVALGADARIETGVQAEARFRHLDPAPTPAEKDAIDLSVAPRLAASVTGGLGAVSASYFPTFTAHDVGPDLRWEHVHQGEARVRLETGPTWGLDAFATGGLGRTDLVTQNRNAATSPGAGGGAGATAIPTVSTVDLVRWRSGAALRVAPDRRTELALSAAIFEDGGSDRISQTVYPVARGADATGTLRWRATRLDVLGLSASATQQRIAALRADSGWVDALATWQRSLAPQVDLRLGAGAVALRSRLPRVTTDPGDPAQGRRTKVQLAPAAQLGLARVSAPALAPEEQATAGRPRRPDATADVLARLGATVDRLTGEATPSADLTGNVRWPLATSVAMVGRGSGLLTWPRSGRTRLGQLELGAQLSLSPRTLLDLGGYGSWQRSEQPGAIDVSEYGAYLRVALSAPPITR